MAKLKGIVHVYRLTNIVHTHVYCVYGVNGHAKYT